MDTAEPPPTEKPFTPAKPYYTNQNRKDIYVDIDNTICHTIGTTYEESTPILDRIKLINDMYDSGKYTITYWSARGMKSGINYIDLTTKQFKLWGVKYHYIKLTKPPFDLFIDDKAINAKWGWNQASVNEILYPDYNKKKPTTDKS